MNCSNDITITPLDELFKITKNELENWTNNPEDALLFINGLKRDSELIINEQQEITVLVIMNRALENAYLNHPLLVGQAKFRDDLKAIIEKRILSLL